MGGGEGGGGGDLFHIAHKHHLWCVEVPFGGYDLRLTFTPTSLSQNKFIDFIIADTWQAMLDTWTIT